MLNENAKLWIEDLRKNGNLQGKASLHRKDVDGDKFCCLGRACVLYNINNPNDTVKVEFNEYSNEFVYDGNTKTLPYKVRQWMGLRDDKGSSSIYPYGCLSGMNDYGKSFAEIADIIESEPEGLFINA